MRLFIPLSILLLFSIIPPVLLAQPCNMESFANSLPAKAKKSLNNISHKDTIATSPSGEYVAVQKFNKPQIRIMKSNGEVFRLRNARSLKLSHISNDGTVVLGTSRARNLTNKSIYQFPSGFKQLNSPTVKVEGILNGNSLLISTYESRSRILHRIGLFLVTETQIIDLLEEVVTPPDAPLGYYPDIPGIFIFENEVFFTLDTNFYSQKPTIRVFNFSLTSGLSELEHLNSSKDEPGYTRTLPQPAGITSDFKFITFRQESDDSSNMIIELVDIADGATQELIIFDGSPRCNRQNIFCFSSNIYSLPNFGFISTKPELLLAKVAKKVVRINPYTITNEGAIIVGINFPDLKGRKEPLKRIALRRIVCS